MIIESLRIPPLFYKSRPQFQEKIKEELLLEAALKAKESDKDLDFDSIVYTEEIIPGQKCPCEDRLKVILSVHFR